MTKPAILQGTRDLPPSSMLVRQHVMGICRESFETFGFEPLETPAIEYAATLEGKYGEEGDRLIYKFEDRGGRQVALRYDLTVPLARFVALHPDLPRPFKRYQMGPVWRADRPQKGRYREFWQCDVDTVGTSSLLADAEMVAVVQAVLRRLGFQQFTVHVNHRRLLNALALFVGVPDAQAGMLFRTIDKWDKIGRAGVAESLREQELPEAASGRLLDLIETEGSSEVLLAALGRQLAGIPDGVAAVDELGQMVEALRALGVPDADARIDLKLARGLDYYTGPIFETTVEEPRIGSLSGGGRYDRLIGLFTGRDVPATGVSLGFERVVDVMTELGMVPPNATTTQVLVTVFDATLRSEALSLTAELRAAGLHAEVSLVEGDLGKQLRYASKKGIRWAAFIGPDERDAGQVAIKDLHQQQSQPVPRSEVAAWLYHAAGGAVERIRG